jgi:predicted ATPase
VLRPHGVQCSRELAALRSLLPDAGSEGGRVALLAGRARVGKSRLVRELAQDAAADGVLVIYGACDAVVRTPYGPFVTALEQLVRVSEPDVLRADLGSGAGELTRLLPDLPQRVGELPDPVPGIRTPNVIVSTPLWPTCWRASLVATRCC